jgi:hypothetical protein
MLVELDSVSDLGPSLLGWGEHTGCGLCREK